MRISPIAFNNKNYNNQRTGFKSAKVQEIRPQNISIVDNTASFKIQDNIVKQAQKNKNEVRKVLVNALNMEPDSNKDDIYRFDREDDFGLNAIQISDTNKNKMITIEEDSLEFYINEYQNGKLKRSSVIENDGDISYNPIRKIEVYSNNSKRVYNYDSSGDLESFELKSINE